MFPNKTTLNTAIERSTLDRLARIGQITGAQTLGPVVDKAVAYYMIQAPKQAIGETVAFADMAPGAVFVRFDGGDGEFDQRLYKVSATEAINTTDAYLRETIDPAAQFLVVEYIQLHDQPTEIERAALALLHRAAPLHPALIDWGAALVSDPDECRGLEQFVLEAGAERQAVDDEEEPTLLEYLKSTGFVFPRHNYDHDLMTAIMDCKPKGEPTKGHDRHWAELDRLFYHLARAVQEYRAQGRPTGDQSHAIQGLGGTLAVVSTSLAAQVAEYHERVLEEEVGYAVVAYAYERAQEEKGDQ